MKTLDPALLTLYRHSEYIVYAKTIGFVLKVDHEHTEFAAFLRQHYNANSFAFISACNPQGVQHPAHANHMRHVHFSQRLQNDNALFLEGLGQAIDTSWQESSFLIINVTNEQALTYGRYLEQLAILYAGPDLIPRLQHCASGTLL